MKYLVIGAGGTGGAIGGFLTRAGKDVTLIARGRHLEAMDKAGLRFETVEGDFTVPVRACTMEEYIDENDEQPDVIFVCVKGYSLDEAVPFIRRAAGDHTVVIPILNIYGTGRRLQDQLPELAVTDGCIYISAEIKSPGVILMSGKIFRVVYGFRKDTPDRVKETFGPVLETVARDLKDGEILPVLSQQIEKDALQKFSYVSPAAVVGACCDAVAGDMQKEGPERDTFAALIREVKALSDAMDASLPENIVQINLDILDSLAPNASTSMQRDIQAGKQSEVEGLVYEVVRLGEIWHVPVPTYAAMAEKLKARLGALG